MHNHSSLMNVISFILSHYNNNNEYLECPTHTGPKRLHVLCKYILSEFNTYNMNVHTCTHIHRLAHAHTRFKSDVSIQVICFIWLQLQMSFIVNSGASWIASTILFESQLSFVPLLSFSLWSKQETLFMFFMGNIGWSVLTGWSFSETSIVDVGHFSF